MRDQFIKTLCNLAESDSRLLLITGDLGFAVFDEYRQRFPDQFINAGIAEQNMTLVATGMALEGYTVFTYSIGNFSTLRCLEMIRNDAAYHGANVKVVSIGGGFSYGSLGISHHATEDLAIMRSLPDVTCVAPTSLWEVNHATREIAKLPGTCFLRLDKDVGPDFAEGEPFLLGIPRKVRSGRDIAFFTTGGILSEVVKASDRLESYGISASIYSVHTLSPVIADPIIAAVSSHDLIVTVEEHSINGGLASLVLEQMGDAGQFPSRFLRIGLQKSFSSIVGSQAYLRTQYGMNSDSIVKRVLDIID